MNNNYIKLNKKVFKYKSFFENIFVNKSIKTLEYFIKNIHEHCNNECKKFDSNLSEEEINNKLNLIKGDLFEIFAALFFEINSSNPEIGLREYEIVDISSDYGVDAFGINANNDKSAVQIKFRSDPKALIEYTELAKTYTYACKTGVITSPEYKKDIVWLFTNADDANDTARKILQPELKVINKNAIKYYINNNENFWINFYNLLDKHFKTIND